MNTKTARIGAKDLVTVGIYSAIYLVITCALAFLSLIPIMYPLMTIICPIDGPCHAFDWYGILEPYYRSNCWTFG